LFRTCETCARPVRDPVRVVNPYFYYIILSFFYRYNRYNRENTEIILYFFFIVSRNYPPLPVNLCENPAFANNSKYLTSLTPPVHHYEQAPA
jgi:hypothetical protein